GHNDGRAMRKALPQFPHAIVSPALAAWNVYSTRQNGHRHWNMAFPSLESSASGIPLSCCLAAEIASDHGCRRSTAVHISGIPEKWRSRWDQGRCFFRMHEVQEGDAPAEPRGKLQSLWLLRIGPSQILPCEHILI